MSLLKHMERWEDVKGYEGLYQVSNCGRVKSLNYNHTGNEKILKTRKARNGYILVNIYKDGKMKTCTVQRLVANAFIPNLENKPEVNHKDENKENNCVSNLEWCDGKYNCNYGTRNEKISKKILCVETNKVYPSAMEAQRQTGINQSNIIRSCQGKRNKAGGYTWKYVN